MFEGMDEEEACLAELSEQFVRSVFVPRNWSSQWKVINGQCIEVETFNHSPRFIGKVNGRYVEE